MMKFGYTIIYVPDVEATVSFYEKAFKLTRNFVHESGYGELLTGDTKLAFASIEMPASHGLSFQKSDMLKAPFEIALVSDQVEIDFQTAIDHGAKLVSAPEKMPWGQMVGYVRDLNGYLVEICSPIK